MKSNASAQAQIVRENKTVKENNTLVVLAYYDIESGKVTWM